jgi:hypothetical protein
LPCISRLIDTICAGCFSSAQHLFFLSFESDSQLRTLSPHSFTQCRHLQIITLPASVVLIGENRFSDCDSLTSVSFDIHSQLKQIGKECFARCPLLGSLVLQSEVTEIGAFAFGQTDSSRRLHPLKVIVDFDNPNFLSTNNSLITSTGTLICYFGECRTPSFPPRITVDISVD